MAKRAAVLSVLTNIPARSSTAGIFRPPSMTWDFEPGASRSCPMRPPAWDAAWPPVAVLRSHVAPRQQRLRRLGLVAPWEIVIQLCAADSRETRKYPILNTMSWDLVV